MSGQRPLRNISDELFETLWRTTTISLEKAAEQLGCSHQALCGRARQMGLPSRLDLKRAKRVSDEEFARMWRHRVKIDDIARVCGYRGRAYIHKRRIKLGLPPRARGRGQGSHSCWGVISIEEYFEEYFAARMKEAA